MHAGKLMAANVDSRTARRSAIAEALTDDPEMLAAINELERLAVLTIHARRGFSLRAKRAKVFPWPLPPPRPYASFRR